jgi:uncharacterized protein (DUF58 family)
MISPRSRLIFLAGLVLFGTAALFMIASELAPIAAIALLVFVLVAVADALFLRPDFHRIRILFPEITRLSKDRPGKLEFQWVNDLPTWRRFRVGLAFPPELGAEQNEFDIPRQAAADAHLMRISCRPNQRGRFFLRAAFLQAPTRLKLWDVRQVMDLAAELRVYPDLLAERRSIAALFLPRGMYGARRYRQVGKGRDFEKLRDYIPGDGVDEVHWKATAKRGRPVTKVFQIERTQEVYVIVDASRLSARFSAGATVLERFINTALILCLAAGKQGDLFGLITFSNNTERFIRARNGKAHYDNCRDALYTLQPQVVTPDFEDLFAFLRLRLRRRALLVFLTSLDDPVLSESFVRHTPVLTRQHLVLVSTLQPVEGRPLFEGNEVNHVDDIYPRLAGHLLWSQLQDVRQQLQRSGVEFSILSAEQLASETVNRYMRIKQRQLL